MLRLLPYVLIYISIFLYYIVLDRKPVDFSQILHHDVDDVSVLSIIIIMKTDKIIHTPPPIDRCCKSSGWDKDLH